MQSDVPVVLPEVYEDEIGFWSDLMSNMMASGEGRRTSDYDVSQ